MTEDEDQRRRRQHRQIENERLGWDQMKEVEKKTDGVTVREKRKGEEVNKIEIDGKKDQMRETTEAETERKDEQQEERKEQKTRVNKKGGWSD